MYYAYFAIYERGRLDLDFSIFEKRRDVECGKRRLLRCMQIKPPPIVVVVVFRTTLNFSKLKN